MVPNVLLNIETHLWRNLVRIRKINFLPTKLKLWKTNFYNLKVRSIMKLKREVNAQNWWKTKEFTLHILKLLTKQFLYKIWWLYMSKKLKYYLHSMYTKLHIAIFVIDESCMMILILKPLLALPLVFTVSCYYAIKWLLINKVDTLHCLNVVFFDYLY